MVKYPDTPWMDHFEALLGTAEIPGPRDNPVIMQLYRDAGFPGIAHEDTAWCAASENAVLKRAGYKTSGSLMARSFLSYGAKVTEPKFGDIVVFERGKAPFGHVGNFIRFVGDKVEVINGNVGDKVCYAKFPKKSVLGYRRPRPEDKIDYVKPTAPSVPVTKAPPMASNKPLPELIDDLRKEGSRTINGADRIEKVVRRFSYWTILAGVVSSTVAAVKEAVGDLGEAANGVVGTVSMVGTHLWVIVPVLGFIVAYELDLIRFARADDAKKGLNVARLPGGEA